MFDSVVVVELCRSREAGRTVLRQRRAETSLEKMILTVSECEITVLGLTLRAPVRANNQFGREQDRQL